MAILGTAIRPRVSLFKSNRYFYVQLIDDVAQKTLVSASTHGSKDKEKPVERARKLAEIIADKAKKSGITRVIFHKGSYKYHGGIKSFAEGLRAAGINL